MGQVFLCKAVHEVGEALYGDEWTGDEPVLPPPHQLWHAFAGIELPLSQEDVREEQRQRVLKLLLRNEIKISEPQRNVSGGLYLNEDDWANGQQLAKVENQKHASGRSRFAGAKAAIIDALLDERLVASLRPKAGGSFSAPIPAHLWNAEGLEPRFYWGQMNPNGPFDEAVGGDAFQYIYISRTTLDALLQQLSGKNVREPVKRYSEKEVRAWFQQLVDDVEAGKRAQPTRDEVEEDAQRVFPNISSTLVRNIYRNAKPQDWSKRGPRPSRAK